MEVKEIKSNDYNISYARSAESAAVFCRGILRLPLEEYKPITDLLNSLIETSPKAISLDLRKLEVLNSSGVAMLAKFILSCRKNKVLLTIKGLKSIPWQKKSIKNFQKLMPELVLLIED